MPLVLQRLKKETQGTESDYRNYLEQALSILYWCIMATDKFTIISAFMVYKAARRRH